MAVLTGTNHSDDIAGTLGDDIIDAKGGPDNLSDLEGNDVVIPGNGADEVHLGPGRDIVEIKPDGGLDQIYGFRSGEDTLMLNGFTSIDGYAELESHFSSDQEAATVTLDLSAASGGTPGAQTVTFLKSFGIGEGDIVFATDRLDGGNPDAVEIDPRVPLDPGQFGLKEETEVDADIDPTGPVSDIQTTLDQPLDTWMM